MRKVFFIFAFMTMFSIGVLAQTDETPQPAYLSATVEDIGKVIGADGNLYKNKIEALKAKTDPVAVILYIGSEANCAHGLALAFGSQNGEKFFDEAIEAGANQKPVLPGGVWRLPTPEDWEYMLLANGSEGKVHKSLPRNSFKFPYLKMQAVLYRAGAESKNLLSYWLAKEYSYDTSCAWLLRLGDYNAEFYVDNKGFGNILRAVLAF